jgi:hypothetical protein
VIALIASLGIHACGPDLDGPATYGPEPGDPGAKADQPAGEWPAQAVLPPETNPYYPGCPWYAAMTGRRDADGRPLYGFSSRGLAVTTVAAVAVDGRVLALDPTIFELGALPEDSEGVPTVEAPSGSEEVPAWARNGTAALVDPRANQAFLAAMVRQLGPELASLVNGSARYRRPDGTVFDSGDLLGVEVVYVAQYGQQPGLVGAGRRIAIRFELETQAGRARFTSDIADPFYVDPTRGGRYGYRAPDGGFAGTYPVENVLAEDR